jgi:hypothetical protein
MGNKRDATEAASWRPLRELGELAGWLLMLDGEV